MASLLLVLGIICLIRKCRQKPQLPPVVPQKRAYVEIPDRTDRQSQRAPTNPQECSPKQDEDSIAIKRKVKNYSSTVSKKKNLTINIPTKDEK
ncbi:hypothetical protein pb186bvf_019453 [Paramecium bursaria]